jgi:carboxypeptidase T
MKLISLLFFFIGLSFLSFAQNYSRVKVFGNNDELFRLGQLGVAVDHGIKKEGVFFISDFSKEEIQIMDQNEFQYEIQIDDVQDYYVKRLNKPSKNTQANLKNSNCLGNSGPTLFSPETPSNFNFGTMGGYLKYEEMLAELDSMFAQYPTLISAKSPISTFLTVENRPIYHVKISDNPNQNEAEPKVLYSAIHHAREPMSLMETIFFMWYLLENYGSNDEVTYLVNNTQLFFVPCLNPDGYVYNQTTNPNGGGMHRKNRRNVGTSNKGVDLNRNYSYGWGTTGVSTNVNSDTYPGTSAFSEVETQAMRWLCQNNNFTMAFNAHSYAEAILFPVGTTNEEFAEHHEYFQDYTNHMVELNGYEAFKSSGLYPASGDSDDYMYKSDLGIGQKDTIFAHTPEVGTAFWPATSDIIPTCAEMVFPNLVLAHLTRNYIIVKDIDPSSIPTLTGSFNHTAKRLGREAGVVTVSIEPILNISSVGNPIAYNLNLQQSLPGTISYVLNPSIQFGDQIKYILKTDNGLWIKKDTITKTYGAITLQVLENATSTANWTGTWGTTSSTYVSPTKSFFDGSTANYSNNANKRYTYVPIIDLTNVSSAMISFYAKWALEVDYDFVQFQVSTDNGATWIGQCGNYTVPGTSANGSVQPENQPIYEGNQPNWVFEEINLSDYLGQQIKVRFQLKSDGGSVADGFYFDDFKIYYNEEEQSELPVASFQTTSNTCANSSILFTDFSLNNPSSWAWTFGDGATSTNQNPSHSYSVPGTFTVSLNVTNAFGSNSISQVITVNPNPTITLSSNDSDNIFCLNDAQVQLSVDPTSSVISGIGISGTLFNPQVAGIGVANITAVYTDTNNCTGTSTLELTVQSCASITNLLENGVSLKPNPNNGNFIISGLDKNTKFYIFDLNGKIVLERTTNLSAEIIQLDHVSSGMYYLHGQKNGQLGQMKFAVIN